MWTAQMSLNWDLVSLGTLVTIRPHPELEVVDHIS